MDGQVASSLPVRGYAQLPDVWDARTKKKPFEPSDRLSGRTSRNRAIRGRESGGARSVSPLKVGAQLQGMGRFSRAGRQSPVRRVRSSLMNPGGSRGEVAGEGTFSDLTLGGSSQATPVVIDTLTSMSMASFSDDGSFMDKIAGGGSRGREGAVSPVGETTDETGGDFLQSWGPMWIVFDFVAQPEELVTKLLARAQSRLEEKWVVGPASKSAIRPPPLELRTMPVAKLSTQQQLEQIETICQRTRPLVLTFDGFRAAPVEKGFYGNLVALEAHFTCPELLLLKAAWLSSLGESFEDYETRLYSPILDTISCTLGRVGVEWAAEIAAIAEDLNQPCNSTFPPLHERAITIEMSAISVNEDVAEGRLRQLALEGVIEESDTRKAGWMSLIISDALDELGGPEGKIKPLHFPVYESPGPCFPKNFRRRPPSSDED